MGRFLDNLAAAARALRANWLRTALTTLGIVIGVGSVVLLVAIGQGVKEDVTTQMDTLGANVIFIVPGKFDPGGQMDFMATLGISTLTEKDVQALKAVPGVVHSIPLMFVAGTVEAGQKSAPAVVLGATADIYGARRRTFEEGRFFTAAEESERVCVVAHEPKQELFRASRAVGRSVSVRGVAFRIVGVQGPEKESLFGPGFFSRSVYIPYRAAREAFHAGQVNRILIQTDLRRKPGPVIAAVKQTLMRNHGGQEDFSILTQEQLLSALYRLFNIVTALLAGISAISLVVAGIGIMNIMLVTVTERTREIGIRKAMGARQTDIFFQFLTEAVTLSFAGGLLGTLLAVAVCGLIAAYSPLNPMITPGAIAMAFGVCFAVGVLFGVAPALRAARMNPVDALRWE